MKIKVITLKPFLIKATFVIIIIMVSIIFIRSILSLNKEEDKSQIKFIETPEVVETRPVIRDLNKPQEIKEPPFVATYSNIRTLKTMEDLTKNLYSIEKDAYVTIEDLDIDKLLNIDFSTNLTGPDPKILIFHTHSQEDFKDSRPNTEEDTIVGIGETLAEILAKDYGISIVHDTGQYDVVDGKISRGSSYERMEPAIRSILAKYPSIEVVIDLHRDGVDENTHLVTEIDGKPTAKIMYFNGITRLKDKGKPVEMPELENPYLENSLAFTLQMELATNELYEGLARRLYIKPYRYSLHMSAKSLLIEAGANTNTVEEVRNAMKPLAEVLVKVIKNN